MVNSFRENIPGDKRSELPNYKDIDWAKTHFRELHKLPLDYRSYVGWRRRSYSGETININEDGTRYTPQPEQVNDNSRLAVFLGGSTMWGSGANDENTIPALFSEISGGRYRTKNLGESDYRSFQSYNFLQIQVNRGMNPDIIISYEGVNERWGLINAFEVSSNSREKQINTALESRGGDLSLMSYLFDPVISFIMMVKEKISRQTEQYTDISYYDLKPERVEKTARRLLDSWLAQKALAEKESSLFVCALHPTAGMGNPYLEHIELDPYWIKPYHHLYPKILQLLQTPQYRELLPHFIDLTDVFDSDEKIYIDSFHVSPNGNKILAEKLYEQVKNKNN